MEETEFDKHYSVFEDAEKKAQDNIHKYFNRIHDKLFTLNNIFIGFYFYFSKIEDKMSILNIIVPLLNLGYFIYIEYFNMQTSRIERNITKIPLDKIDKKLYSRYRKITLFSLFSIISTLIVFLILLYHILF